MKARIGFALIALWLGLLTPPGHPCIRECKLGLKHCKLGCEKSGTPAQIKNCKEQACTLLLKSCIKECAREKSPDEGGG